MAETAAVALFGGVGRTGIQMQRADGGHQEHVSQVRVTGTAQVGMRESHDGRVIPAVTGAEGVHLVLIPARHVVGNGVGIRTHLHAAERHAGAGKGMPHPGGADKRIYIGRQTGLGGLGHRRTYCQQGQCPE